MDNHIDMDEDKNSKPDRKTPPEQKTFYPQPGNTTIRHMSAPDYYNVSSISKFVDHVPWPYVRRNDTQQKEFFPFSGNHLVYPYYAKFYGLENLKALRGFVDNLVGFCVELNKCENFGRSRSKKLENMERFCEVATKARSQIFTDLRKIDENIKFIKSDNVNVDLDLRYFTSENKRLIPDLIGDLISKLLKKINESVEGCAGFTLVCVNRSTEATVVNLLMRTEKLINECELLWDEVKKQHGLSSKEKNNETLTTTGVFKRISCDPRSSRISELKTINVGCKDDAKEGCSFDWKDSSLIGSFKVLDE